MSTEDERIAKKELEIEKLKAQVEKARKEVYFQLEQEVETDEQKELLKKYKSLDREADRFDERYWKRSEELRDERDKVFEELTDSLK